MAFFFPLALLKHAIPLVFVALQHTKMLVHELQARNARVLQEEKKQKTRHLELPTTSYQM